MILRVPLKAACAIIGFRAGGVPVFVGPAVAFPCDILDPLSQDG